MLEALVNHGHDIAYGPCLANRDFHRGCHFFEADSTSELGFQFRVRVAPLVNQFDHVGRDMNRLGIIENGSFDGLLDPPCRVGAESYAMFGIKGIHGTQKAEGAFFNEITEGQSSSGELLGDIDDQPQVAANQAVAGFRVIVVQNRRRKCFLFVPV
jgi:hypothetical protein